MQMIGDASSSKISLYFHIPFCTRKCDYCHFYVVPDKESAKEQLTQGFQLEWALLQPLLADKQIVTVYFGGGTPSLFAPYRILSLLNLVKSTACLKADAEITLEVNPENVTLELMQAYAASGINRVSIGIQTLDAELLHLLGRGHGPETAIQAVRTTHQAGIDNISIDLMYDLPKQTLQHWSTTLDAVSSLPIRHLSLYNLTIEPHTLFFKKKEELQSTLPEEEISLAMYEMAIDRLEKMDLRRYEISAFAQIGFESKHNTGYWTARPFLGLGPSAFSYWEGKRMQNIANLSKYCQILKEGKLPIDFQEELDPDHQRRELFVIHLRLREGVDMHAFTKQHGSLDTLTQASLHRLIQEGYLLQHTGRITLTHKGVLFYDTVASELI